MTSLTIDRFQRISTEGLRRRFLAVPSQSGGVASALNRSSDASLAAAPTAQGNADDFCYQISNNRCSRTFLALSHKSAGTVAVLRWCLTQHSPPAHRVEHVRNDRCYMFMLSK
jgi:hypothetical protein